MRLDRAAADGDVAVLVRLKADADDIHIEVAVEGEPRVLVVSVAGYTAIARIDTAHVVVGDIRAGRCAARCGIGIGEAELQIAADRQLSAVEEVEPRHILVCAAAAGAGDIDGDIVIPENLFVVDHPIADAAACRMLFDLALGGRQRQGVRARVCASAVGGIADLADLERGCRRGQTLGDLHLSREVALAALVRDIVQFLREAAERVVDLQTVGRIRRARVEPGAVRAQDDVGPRCGMLHDEVAAEKVAVRLAPVDDALPAAVAVDGDRILLLLEDCAGCALRGAAEEFANLAARVEVGFLRSLICGAVRHGGAFCADPFVLPLRPV